MIKAWIFGQKQIYRYTIYKENEKVEENILGWQTALAHARKYTKNLFDQPRKVEILNQWTGEIIRIEEAEERAKAYKKKTESGRQ
jgi:hypothetical protein